MEFPRSYVFSNEPFPGAVECGPGYVSCGSETHVATAKCGFFTRIAIIGYLIDLNRPGVAEATIAEEWARLAGRDPSLVFEASNTILGRYVAIIRRRGRWYVFGDAAGMRTIHYAPGQRFFLSSHSVLIADQNNAPERGAIFTTRAAMPGNAAPYDGIRLVPANFWLNPVSGALKRFWPVRERSTCSVEEASSRLDGLLTRAADAIGDRWRPAVSLTAGIDSRMTFAAFRTNPDAMFFTYTGGSSGENRDVAIARDICSRYGLKHLVIHLDFRKLEQEQTWKRLLVDYRHNRWVVAPYIRHFSGGDWVHVRSNLAEIGRSFWRKNGVSRLRRDRLAALIPVKQSERESWIGPASAESQRFAELLGYVGKNDYRGYDPLDLYYWEQRMSMWHGPLLLGSDFAFETAILFNCRLVLETLLAVGHDARMSGELFRRYIAAKLPDLEAVPLNPAAN